MPKHTHQNLLSPKFSGLLFFFVYAFFFFLFARYTLFALSSKISLPFLPTLSVALISGAGLGYLFGGLLAKPQPWWRLFLWGCVISLLAVLFISLCTMIYGCLTNSFYNEHLQGIKDYLIIYGVIALSLALIIGPWLLIITSITCIYFNKHFYPGLVAFDKQRHPPAQ